jgi:hypothetical protein
MPDVIDTLKWQPWPKDPEWVYADIVGVARVGRKQTGTRYFLRALGDNGALGSWHYTNVERDHAAKILDEAISARNLRAAV